MYLNFSGKDSEDKGAGASESINAKNVDLELDSDDDQVGKKNSNT
jgi:hypothetical protein